MNSTKSKIILSISVFCLVLAVSVLAMMSVWALTRQQFGADINVEYVVREVRGSASARWLVGETSTSQWNSMDTNGPTTGGSTIITFNKEALTNASLSPTVNTISMDESHPFIVFEYNFTNFSENDYFVDLTYTDDSNKDTNVNVYALASTQSITSGYVSGISNAFTSNTISLTVPGTASSGYSENGAYIYILVKVANQTTTASFSGDFNFYLYGSQDLKDAANS